MCVLGAFFVTSADAELSDPPHFNLWNTATTINGHVGDGATVSLCGTSVCGPNDSAIFSVFNGMPTGSGFIDPFLRFQHNDGPEFNGSSTTEAAYNTDDRDATGTYRLQDTGDPGSNFTNQAKDNNAFNHSITIGSLDGSDGYFHFLLDINEPAAENMRTLRLDELQFFVASDPDLDLYDPDVPDAGNSGNGQAAGSLAGATKVWDMDYDGIAGGGWGGLNLDNVNDGGGGAGSGDYDLEVKLSVDLFAGFSETDYIYLYNFAGDADRNSDFEAEAGFEEWATVASADPGDNRVPEPGTFLLIGTGIVGLLGVRRRRGDGCAENC